MPDKAEPKWKNRELIRLYENHLKLLFKIAYGIVPCSQGAEEAVNELFRKFSKDQLLQKISDLPVK